MCLTPDEELLRRILQKVEENDFLTAEDRTRLREKIVNSTIDKGDIILFVENRMAIENAGNNEGEGNE